MKLTQFAAILAATCGLAAAHAADLKPGQRLTAEERKNLASSSHVRLGEENFQLVPPKSRLKAAAPGNEETWVVNSQGVVGRSSNEVMVGQIDVDAVRAALTAHDLPPVVNVQYYAANRISAIRFANFADAVRARDLLANRLPGASVTVPVQYSRPRAR